MPVTYTPPVNPAFPSFPITLVTPGDNMTDESVNSIFRPIFDGLQNVKDANDLTEGRLDAALGKLGITVVDENDTALPTYSSGFLLTGALSHHDALETLDTAFQGVQGDIANINTNVGGNVADAAPPTYSSTNVIDNGDSHHEALEKIDTFLQATRDIADGSVGDISDTDTRVTNIVAKLDATADDAPAWDYSSNNFVADGQTVKSVIELYDRIHAGTRRLANQNYERHVTLWKQQDIANTFSFFDTLQDLTKRDPSSTVTIDTLQQKATGAGTTYFAQSPGGGTLAELKLIWFATGTVEVAFNLIGSFADGDFFVAAAQDTFYVPTSGSGATVVIRVKLTGAAELYNVAAIGRP